jgi:hypothetical protein
MQHSRNEAPCNLLINKFGMNIMTLEVLSRLYIEFATTELKRGNSVVFKAFFLFVSSCAYVDLKMRRGNARHKFCPGKLWFLF